MLFGLLYTTHYIAIGSCSQLGDVVWLNVALDYRSGEGVYVSKVGVPIPFIKILICEGPRCNLVQHIQGQVLRNIAANF